MPLFFLAWVGNFVTSKSWCIRWHKGQYCFILPVANVSPSLEWNNSSYGRCQLLFNPHRMTNCFWFIFGSVPLIWRLTSCFWANKSPSQNTRSLMFLNILLYNCFRLHFSKLPWAEPIILGLFSWWFGWLIDPVMTRLENYRIDEIEAHLSKYLCVTLI